MPTPYPPLDVVPNAPIAEVDDATLRTAHPVLNADRAAKFSDWMDRQLAMLEFRYRHNITRRTVRRSLGR